VKQLALFAVLGLAGAVLGGAYLGDALGVIFPDSGSNHGPWFASRAAGMASYFMLWLAAIIGTLMSSAWFDGLVNRGRLLAMHQASTYGGLLLGVGHALVLIPDEWTQFGMKDLFVPFASYFEPTQTALGTLALYLFALVAFSFWVRGAIGTQLWRLIHFTSFIALAGAFWHGIALGTDSTEPWALPLYIVTSGLLVVAVVIRLTYLKPKPVRQPRPAVAKAGATEKPAAAAAKLGAAAKPAMAAKPEVATKPATAAKPEVATKPETAAKPEVAAKPAAAARPLAPSTPVARSTPMAKGEAGRAPDDGKRPEVSAAEESAPAQSSTPQAKPDESLASGVAAASLSTTDGATNGSPASGTTASPAASPDGGNAPPPPVVDTHTATARAVPSALPPASPVGEDEKASTQRAAGAAVESEAGSGLDTKSHEPLGPEHWKQDTREALAAIMAEMRAKVLADVLDEMREEVVTEVLEAMRSEGLDALRVVDRTSSNGSNPSPGHDDLKAAPEPSGVAPTPRTDAGEGDPHGEAQTWARPGPSRDSAVPGHLVSPAGNRRRRRRDSAEPRPRRRTRVQ